MEFMVFIYLGISLLSSIYFIILEHEKWYYALGYFALIMWLLQLIHYIIENTYHFFTWGEVHEMYPGTMWFLIISTALLYFNLSDKTKNNSSYSENSYETKYNYSDYNKSTNNYNKEYNFMIKWNVNFKTWEKIYHLPWCENYSETIINESYWEKYFNTEKEALEAWFRKAKNCNL